MSILLIEKCACTTVLLNVFIEREMHPHKQLHAHKQMYLYYQYTQSVQVYCVNIAAHDK